MRRAFTLIELVVVVAIVALLLGILLPVTGKARMQAKVLIVNAELRDIGLALEAYSFDHEGAYPPVRPNCATSAWPWRPIRSTTKARTRRCAWTACWEGISTTRRYAWTACWEGISTSFRAS